jgi:hypothetical protein
MITKIFSGLVVVFWLVMMTLLVRQEFFPSDGETITVSPKIVVARVFNNDDPSTLKVYFEGNEVGSARFHVKTIEKDSLGSFPAERRDAASRSKYDLSVELSMKLTLMETATQFHIATIMMFDENYERTWYSFRFRSGERYVQMERDMASPLLTLKIKEGALPVTHVINVGMDDPKESGSQLNLLGLDADTIMGMMAGELGTPTGGAPKTKITTSQTSLRIAGQMVPAYLVHLRHSENVWFKIWIGRQGQVLLVDTSINLLMLADGLRLNEVLRDRPRPRL